MRGPTEPTPVQRRQLRDVAELIAAAEALQRRHYAHDDRPMDGTALRIVVCLLVMIFLGVAAGALLAIYTGAWPWPR